jgi:hypothetical protein
MTKTMLFTLLFAAGSAAAAEETERPVMVISTAGGASAGATTAGGEVGVYNGAGRFRYGVSALVTGGNAQWAGGLIDARWTLLESTFSPYVGLGLGAFSARRGSLDLGVQPTAAVEAGVSFWRFFAGARALIPLSRRSEGLTPHDVGGFGEAALLGQVGFRI